MSKVLLGIALLAASASQALAGISVLAIPTPLPTLDEVGLIALTAVVGIAGGIAARRRKKKK
jgi:hypothetical protein